MQLSGAACEICSAPIVLQAEGACCAKCGSAVHRACLSPRMRCVRCQNPWESADAHSVASEQCPHCWEPSGRDLSNCPFCGGSKVFDSETAYQARQGELQSLGWRMRMADEDGWKAAPWDRLGGGDRKFCPADRGRNWMATRRLCVRTFNHHSILAAPRSRDRSARMGNDPWRAEAIPVGEQGLAVPVDRVEIYKRSVFAQGVSPKLRRSRRKHPPRSHSLRRLTRKFHEKRGEDCC